MRTVARLAGLSVITDVSAGEVRLGDVESRL